jgi:oligoribonuclease NrnB/cAMP/cGMP phosphodiesterase (DHH superfamily)
VGLIIYHNACPDGWCAAFVAAKRYPNAQLLARDHGLEPPYEAVEGRNVLVVDFSWRTREQNDRMANLAKSFRILDHHRTAQTVLEGAPYATFDMARSGAGLAWDFLFGKDSMGPYGEKFQERPWYVNYVEDRDLWNWKLSHSREINAYLMTLPHTKEAWDTLDQQGFDQARAIQLGVGALSHVEHYVREAVKHARVGVLRSFNTAVLNVPYLNCSEVGNELAKAHGVSLTWFERGDGVVQFSLRGNGNMDVSEIAKAFNGGGHRNAAGFQLPLPEARKTLDEILGRTNV